MEALLVACFACVIFVAAWLLNAWLLTLVAFGDGKKPEAPQVWWQVDLIAKDPTTGIETAYQSMWLRPTDPTFDLPPHWFVIPDGTMISMQATKLGADGNNLANTQ